MSDISKFTYKLKDLPALDDAAGIARFAHKFDGYKHYGSFDLCAMNAHEKRRESLIDILNELFFACRSARHGGGNDEIEAYKELRPYLERYAEMSESVSLTFHDLLAMNGAGFNPEDYKRTLLGSLGNSSRLGHHRAECRH